MNQRKRKGTFISHSSGSSLTLHLLPEQNTDYYPSSHSIIQSILLIKVERKRGASYPGEECVEAVDFLPLGDVGIVLSNALQCEFLHQVYLVGLLEMLGLGHKHRFNTCNSMFLKESFL